MGSEVQEFERILSNFFDRPAVCVVNGTAALHLALQACDIGFGDEVLVPSLTYISSFQAISATGAKPVACDIDSNTFLLDLLDAKKRITKNTRAIMPVHYTGGVGNLDALYKLANEFKLQVIEDAAHAFGSTYNGKRIGSFGNVTCFSFDGIKNITSGEGGCVITDNQLILQNIKDARLLGVKKDTDKRYLKKRSWEFNVTAQGWRYHMSNIMAAIGIEQMKRFPEFAETRKKLAKKYDQQFSNHKKIISVVRDYSIVVPHIYVIRIIGMKNRDDIKEAMLKKGVELGYHYYPNHWLSFYKNKLSLPLPVTDSIFPELLTLPLHPDLSVNDIDFVSHELIKLIDN